MLNPTPTTHTHTHTHTHTELINIHIHVCIVIVRPLKALANTMFLKRHFLHKTNKAVIDFEVDC